MPATTSKSTAPKLMEDSLVALDLLLSDGCYIVTMDDPAVNSHDIWFVPEGVKSLKNSQVVRNKEGVTLEAALRHLADLAEKDLSNLPTEAEAAEVAQPVPAKKTAPAKSAAPAKKAAATKPAPAKPSASKAPAKKAPAKKAAARKTV